LNGMNNGPVFNVHFCIPGACFALSVALQKPLVKLPYRPAFERKTTIVQFYNLPVSKKDLPLVKGILLVLGGFFLVGCNEPTVTTHEYPAEEYQPHSAGAPWLKWELPSGWQEGEGGSMRYASFRTVDAEGRQTDVSVTTFAGQVGSDLDNVNRWRRQVGLFPISEESLSAGSTKVTVADKEGILVDLVGESPEALGESRILGAIYDGVGGRKWYFKMTGSPAAVEVQRDAFLAFLAGLEFEAPLGFSSLEDAAAFGATDAPAMPMPPMMSGGMPPSPRSSSPPPADTSGLPEWKVPEGWQQVTGSSMAVATFQVTFASGSGTLAVSKWPNDVGGIHANLNRWRGQVGLEPITEAQLSKYIREIDVNGMTLTIMDTHGANENRGLESAAQRILSVWYPKDGGTWIFKLRGASDMVVGEEAKLIEFVRSIKFSDNA